ncbi:two-component system response regulator [Curvibacter sp. APW13]|uniref:response regulator n=1 Tax=Curvibacter sp. APW13 TaxID=3077236 RepID=UPI0028DF5D42|nr:two-component system response regulator [Curvibacter sp. APW13]MDT8990719.1 two-component system response regulator [Curvibacter sp. APW13]
MPTTTNPAERPMILVVDDTPTNLSLMNDLLGPHYRVKAANSGMRALKIVAGDAKPDLILLDIMMPEMDGYEVCRQLKASPDTRDIPVIFLTAKSETSDEQTGLELGAVDYITKPISPPIVLSRIKTHLALKASADFLKDQNQYLEQEVQRRTEDLREIQYVTILTMASLAETRDNETGGHIVRTQHYVRLLAQELRKLPKYAATLDDHTIDLLFKSAPLHDIGKVGIPDHVLLKPGRLTPEEFEIMKTHTTLGRAAIEAAEARLGKSVPFLECAKEIAYCHQEKWDGSGYPQGLRGDAIPLSARLMALADVYDALISKRVYKPAFDHAKAKSILLEGRGSHFDPDVIDAFLAVEAGFRAIATEYSDDEV